MQLFSVSPAEQFTLGGQVFTPRSSVPYKAYLRRLRDLQGETPEESDKKLDDFLEFLVVKEDRERLRSLLNADDDADACVTQLQLQQLTNWLIETHTGRPLGSTGSSTNGAEPTPESQKVISLDPPAAS